MSYRLLVLSLAVTVTVSKRASAQDLDSSPSNESNGAAQIEDLYEKEEVKQEKKEAPVSSAPRIEPKRIKNVTDLADLAPFADVAVIQRRFLPKTHRFEFSGTGFTNLNNPFFNSLGVSARLAYYLVEQFALEGIGSFESTSNRQVTDDLEKKRGISTASVISSKSFYALALKWNPIYGKMTWLNHSIVPFDLNFNLGFGMTQTTDNQSAPTLHLGTSQVFALSKSMAFRWDLVWNTYRAKGTDNNGVTSTQFENDLFLGLGMSFYFPEATYR